MQAPPSNGTVEVCEGYIITVAYKNQHTRYIVFSESELRLKLEELHQEVKIVDPETKEEIRGIDQEMLDLMCMRINSSNMRFNVVNTWRNAATKITVMFTRCQNMALRWDLANSNEKPFNSEATNTKSASKH